MPLKSITQQSILRRKISRAHRQVLQIHGETFKNSYDNRIFLNFCSLLFLYIFSLLNQLAELNTCQLKWITSMLLCPCMFACNSFCHLFRSLSENFVRHHVFGSLLLMKRFSSIATEDRDCCQYLVLVSNTVSLSV